MRIPFLLSAPFDELGLRQAHGTLMTSAMVAGIVILAAFAVAGWVGSHALAHNWKNGGGEMVTILIPKHLQVEGEKEHMKLTTRILAQNGVRSIQILTAIQIEDLFRKWIDADVRDFHMPIPTVVTVNLTGGTENIARFDGWLIQQDPSIIVEVHADWASVVTNFWLSMDLAVSIVTLTIGVVTIGLIVMILHFTLSSQRQLILTIHQLGASDRYIMQRFVNRGLSPFITGGTVGGALTSIFLFELVAPLMSMAKGDATAYMADVLPMFLPVPLWCWPVIPPLASAIIGYITLNIILRVWLRQTGCR